jgi:hypothetical protein
MILKSQRKHKHIANCVQPLRLVEIRSITYAVQLPFESRETTD